MNEEEKLNNAEKSNSNTSGTIDINQILKMPSNSIKVKVSFDTLPPLPKMQLPVDIYDGSIKVHELLNKIELDKRKEFDKNDSILIFLKSSFLVNPFDTLADLASCFGVKGANDIKELNLKISKTVSWG